MMTHLVPHVVGLVHYPFQLRPGLFVYFYLPAHFTSEDVAKLGEFLRSLVVEDEVAMTEHTP
jgi:hypothetical protein